MLVHSIVTKNLHTVQMNHIQHNSEVKNKNITSQNPDTTALPSYSAVRSYTNISFKGACELTKAVIYDEVNNLNKELAKTGINSENKYDTAIIETGRWRSIQCFKELRKHPGIDIYAENIDGWMCFTYACLWNCKYIIQDLCDDPHFDVNYQSKKTGDNGLIVACRNGKEEAVDIILQRDDVDLTLRNKENQSAFDCAKDYPSILKKLQNYEARQKELAVQKQAELNKTSAVTDKYNRSTGATELIQAIYDDNKAKFDILIEDPDTDVNERDKFDFTPLMRAALSCRTTYYFERLLQHPKIKVNEVINDGHSTHHDWCALTAIAERIDDKQVEFFEKILEHPDVDVKLYFDYDKKHILIKHGDYKKYEEMMHNYKKGVDKRHKKLILQKPNVDKILSFKEIWTDEEKAKLEKLIRERDFDEIGKFLVIKGAEIDAAYGNIKQKTAEVTAEIEKYVRAEVTPKIHEEENKKAELRFARQKEKLDNQLKEARKKEATFNSLIEKTQSLIDQGIEDAKSGIRALYEIKTEKLPDNMGFGEQLLYVTNILKTNENKLTNTNADTPETITLALLDNKKHLSDDALMFLSRILSTSENKCSEKDLTDAIKSVKVTDGFFDLNKVSLFLSSLSWKGNTIQSAIKKVEKYSANII